jgi:hypothetical protein
MSLTITNAALRAYLAVTASPVARAVLKRRVEVAMQGTSEALHDGGRLVIVGQVVAVVRGDTVVTVVSKGRARRMIEAVQPSPLDPPYGGTLGAPAAGPMDTPRVETDRRGA